MCLPVDEEVVSCLGRFVLRKSEECLAPIVDELRRAVSQLQSQVATSDAAVQSFKARTTELEQNLHHCALASDVESLARTVTVLDESVQRKADAERLQKLGNLIEQELAPSFADIKSSVRGWSERVTRVESALEESRERLQMMSMDWKAELQKQYAVVAELNQNHVASLKVLGDDLQKFQSSTDRQFGELSTISQDTRGKLKQLQQVSATTDSRLGDAERALHEKASAERLHQVEAKLPGVEQGFRDTAEKIHQVEAIALAAEKQLGTVEQALREKVSFVQIRQFEGVVTGMQTHLGNLEQSLQEKAPASQVAKFRAELGEFDVKIVDFEQNLLDKANVNHLQQLKAMCSTIEARVNGVEQVVQEKVGAGTITQLKGIIQSIQLQVAAVEQAAKEKEKGATEVVLQIRNQFSALQKQLNNLEQVLHEKVNPQQFQQVKNAMAGLEAKVGQVEACVQERLPNTDFLQVMDTVSTMQTKLSGIERAVWEGMDCAQQLEGVISSVKAQASGVEQALREKAASQDLQAVGERLATMAGKLGSLERCQAATGDRTHQVEDALTSLGSQLGALRREVQDRLISRSGGRAPLQLELVQIP